MFFLYSPVFLLCSLCGNLLLLQFETKSLQASSGWEHTLYPGKPVRTSLLRIPSPPDEKRQRKNANQHKLSHKLLLRPLQSPNRLVPPQALARAVTVLGAGLRARPQTSIKTTGSNIFFSQSLSVIRICPSPPKTPLHLRWRQARARAQPEPLHQPRFWYVTTNTTLLTISKFTTARFCTAAKWLTIRRDYYQHLMCTRSITIIVLQFNLQQVIPPQTEMGKETFLRYYNSWVNKAPATSRIPG